MRPVLPLVLVLAACKPPPPAPEGLDDTTSYMIRNFYTADPEFQAGLQGFMNWFDDEGHTLVGQEANADNTNAFVVHDLTMDDIGYLPMEADLRSDPDRTSTEPRDLSQAKGVVSLAEMDCVWTDAERLIARPDQNEVFDGDFEAYERSYLTDRETWHKAARDLVFDPVDEPLTVFDEGFDLEAYEHTLLRTNNLVDPTAIITANIGEYPMHLDLRHGEYERDGDQFGAMVVMAWIEDAAWGSSGNNALMQSYSLEVDVQRPDDKTLRMLSLWTEPRGTGIDPTSAFTLNYAVNKSLKSSQRMSDICAGKIEIPAEPE
jgi:hypothetical protein